MSKKILVIEDNTDIRENIEEILELANFTVFTAENGKVGVRIAKQELPDIIICDIMMPELDGYGVLHILSRDMSTSSIPFIFLTAKVEKEDFRKGMNLGADDYVTKPFSENDLLDAIESRLKRKDNLSHPLQETTNANQTSIHSLEELVKGSKLKNVVKKEYIYREGDYPNYIYFVEKGKVKTYLINDDGKEFVVGIYGPGEYFGFSNLPENQNHKEMAAAMENSEVRFINRFDFLQLLNTNKEASALVLGIVSTDLLQKEQQLINLAYNTVRKRVADALLNLSEKYSTEGEGAEITISRQDLAGIVGTATESVIRIVSEFKEDGILEVKGSKIKVINPKALNNVMF